MSGPSNPINPGRGLSPEILRALSDLIGEAGRATFWGKYAGIVTNRDDPKSIGRLRARVPEVFGMDQEAGWALPCLPWGGGKNRGFYALPEVGDTVWIEFEAGDPMRPIWTGTFWGAPESSGGQDDLGTETGAETPEGPDGPAKPGLYILRTKSGHVVSLDDDGGLIVIAEASGAEIRISGQGEITLKADKITLGDGGSEALILGNSFMQMFNSHTHPTGVGPSGPPAQPMTSSHLSQVSKTK
ncbi:phage baseplate assembly protein V [Paracoccus litorisediminis]|uniref:Baseplate assembly protein n=1 Tax=Paracoccus litorisediminis TaxID=2006130 RepID=A0A844HHE7_9RHOB|nr:phage baseplate assembly protein V [Paracoccus litorisediminis]MTH59473.1 baseplate assembly protein [Paracoccus litorisediminis]